MLFQQLIEANNKQQKIGLRTVCEEIPPRALVIELVCCQTITSVASCIKFQIYMEGYKK